MDEQTHFPKQTKQGSFRTFEELHQEYWKIDNDLVMLPVSSGCDCGTRCPRIPSDE